jgi:hypothetical protein
VRAVDISSDMVMGYSGGPGGQVGVNFSHFIENSGLSIRLGMGYNSTSPGDPVKAREIFVNEADNGTPESSAHDYVWRLDFVAPQKAHPGTGWRLSGGPRYSRFVANFRYVGGNEEFDVRAHQWGLGGGADYTAPMGSNVSFRLGGGVDYFFPSMLEGHDSEYSPDNANIGSKENFKYEDADQAINQPTVQFRAQAGIVMRLGTP